MERENFTVTNLVDFATEFEIWGERNSSKVDLRFDVVNNFMIDRFVFDWQDNKQFDYQEVYDFLKASTEIIPCDFIGGRFIIRGV